ncbi:MAG: hypothetical protein II388_06045, partial [Clostridia bacterium]|nr:hypothetical protein [Clostridia bacterium]
MKGKFLVWIIFIIAGIVLAFVIPNNIGGRFSVLTPVGLLPIAVSGINIDRLMNGAILAEDKYDDSCLEYNECYKY